MELRVFWVFSLLLLGKDEARIAGKFGEQLKLNVTGFRVWVLGVL